MIEMKPFSEADVRHSAFQYFNGDTLAVDVWMSKYALKDKEGNYKELNPNDTHKRISKELARIESKYPNPISEQEIYELLKNFKYIIPGGSNLYGIGNNYRLSSLGNCFVVGNKADSYGGIFQTDQEQTQLMKMRAGVGHDISHYRPKDVIVSNTAGTSVGIVPLMERFSNSTREVSQNGRRGALMLSISVKHPDIKDFIEAKQDLTKVTGANVSIRITDDFMEAVNKDLDYMLSFPVDMKIPFGRYYDNVVSTLKYNVLTEIENVYDSEDNLIPKGYLKLVKAREIWDLIVYNAWNSAEPGLLFWDNIINESPADCYKDFQTTSTNPCGEIPLCPYDSCRLVSLNMFGFIENPYTHNAKLNWEKFKEVSYISQKVMDDIIDLEEEKILKILKKLEEDSEPEYVKITEINLWQNILSKLIKGRRTGLSVIGIGDSLAALGLKYDSDEAINLSEEIYKVFALESYRASIDMAKERGTFPVWNHEVERYNPYIARIMENISEPYKLLYETYGRRNIANLTIPPSGSLAILAQITSGIEPVFALYYTRRRKVEKNHHKIDFIDQNGDCWEEYKVFHSKFIEWFDLNWYKIDPNWFNIDYHPDIHSLSKEKLDEIIMKSPYYKSTANEIDPIQKVKMQGKIQKWVDHSISVTHNLPKETTKEQISEIYKLAHEYGCKGCTIYRDESRSGVLVTGNPQPKNKFESQDAYKRPKSLNCDIHSVKVRGEAYIVLIGLLDDKPYEVFALKQNGYEVPKIKHGHLVKVKKGYYNLLDSNKEILIENITSHFERPIDEAITRLVSTSLRHRTDIKFIVEQLNKTPAEINDFSKIIGRTIKKYIKENESSTENCPECGNKLIFTDGCVKCISCTFQKC